MWLIPLGYFNRSLWVLPAWVQGRSQRARQGVSRGRAGGHSPPGPGCGKLEHLRSGRVRMRKKYNLFWKYFNKLLLSTPVKPQLEPSTKLWLIPVGYFNRLEWVLPDGSSWVHGWWWWRSQSTSLHHVNVNVFYTVFCDRHTVCIT